MTTAKRLKKRIAGLNQEDGRQPGQPLEYILDMAYGGYKVCQTSKDGYGLTDLSDRGTAKETDIWLAGFEMARLIAQREVQG